MQGRKEGFLCESLPPSPPRMCTYLPRTQAGSRQRGRPMVIGTWFAAGPSFARYWKRQAGVSWGLGVFRSSFQGQAVIEGQERKEKMRHFRRIDISRLAVRWEGEAPLPSHWLDRSLGLETPTLSPKLLLDHHRTTSMDVCRALFLPKPLTE